MNPRAHGWFERHTFHAGRWTPSQLAEVKGELSVSVVLPARDEEATVGQIVRRLRRDLIEEVPLVEEVVVIDSGSCDETSAVAARAGARVVRQSDVLTSLGDRPGKGEALWKALLVTSGDIIAFIDADLCDFDPQFVVGLVGPLLTDTETRFVKGFYDRPLATGVTVMPAGGGRVTEMLARPLLNLHYPELAGLVQPLAGEYAARRSLLESIPFVSGYGVEIAMLLDVLHTVGIDAMAQVDLGVRRHRNSSDTLLGQMAAQVYLAFLSRLERHGAAVFADEPTDVMTQFTRHGDRFLPTNVNVAITERPPMCTVAEYRQRHGSPEPQERP